MRWATDGPTPRGSGASYAASAAETQALAFFIFLDPCFLFRREARQGFVFEQPHDLVP